jgi:hypothetical protein
MPGALVTFTLGRGAIAHLIGAHGEAAGDLLRRGNRVKNRAQQLVRVNTGVLRSSIHVSPVSEAGGSLSVQVGTNVPYALFVHEGTGLYGPRGALIRPRNASVLRWPAINNSGSGRRRYKAGATAGYVFSRYSRGSPPNHFLTDALSAGAG